MTNEELTQLEAAAHDVTRFSLDMDASMVCDEDGDWVRHEDFDNRVVMIDRLLEQIAVLQKDAARYQWLKSNFRVMSLDMGGNHTWTQARMFQGPSVDEGIDRIIEARQNMGTPK